MSLSIDVLVFKEGLLARAGHDLLLRCEADCFELEGDRVRATCNPKSLQVVTALKRGAPNPSALSAADKQTIWDNMMGKVFEVARFPQIGFQGRVVRSESSLQVEGSLSLHGACRPLSVRLTKKGENFEGSFLLHQPSHGIKVFKAALGALRVKKDVEVRLSLPASMLG